MPARLARDQEGDAGEVALIALVADQWLGGGRVFALLRGDEAFRVLAWDPERPDAVAEALGTHRFDAIDAWPALAPDPIHVAALPGSLTLLFRGARRGSC